MTCILTSRVLLLDDSDSENHSSMVQKANFLTRFLFSDFLETIINHLRDQSKSVNQMLALNDFRHSIEQSTVEENDEYTSERLSMLEDASHRQLEVLESLIEAVEKLNVGTSGANERLANLEALTRDPNKKLFYCN